MEEYKFFNPYVLISNYGRISFLTRPRVGKRITFGNDIGNGHMKVTINQKNYLVHRLVWQVFNGEIPDDYVVHHIDGNPQNNHLDNLCLMKSDEHYKYHSSGGNNCFKGKHHTDESKQKLRLAHLGKTLSEEHKRKIANASKGRCHTDETKQKISIAAKARWEKYHKG